MDRRITRNKVILVLILVGAYISVNYLYLYKAEDVIKTTSEEGSYDGNVRPPSDPVIIDDSRTINEVSYGPIPNPKIFIVSMPRSGSSLMLEVIGHHPNVLPMFETTVWMRTISKEKGCELDSLLLKDKNSEEARWFQDLYSCNITEDFKLKMSPFSLQKSGDISKCISGNPPSKIVATKEIWPWGTKLNRLNEIVGQDLRVISLTRDPRGFVSSFTYVPVRVSKTMAENGTEVITMTKETSLYFGNAWNMHDTDLWETFCLDGVDIPFFLRPRMPYIKRVMQDKGAAPHLRMACVWTLMTAVTQYYLNTLFKGRNMAISHTEFSLHPHEIANEIFNFLLGEKAAPTEVHEFIDSHTQGGGFNDRYSTARNSTEASQVWSTRLSPSQIADIEAIANDIMQPLSFDQVSNGALPALDPENYERLPTFAYPRPPLPVFSSKRYSQRVREAREVREVRVEKSQASCRP